MLATDPATGRLRARQALIGMPRKQGKSALISGLALWQLYLGPDGGEVYSVAGDREQARIVFGTGKRMVEMQPELLGEAKVYRDAIEHVPSGSVWRVVSSDAPLKEGLSPTFTVVDEVHVIDEELWNVFALAQGARPEPLMVGITTAGTKTDSHGRDTLCYRLWQHGTKVASGELADPSFYFAWWAAPDDADWRDEQTWRIANPGYDDIVAADDFRSAVLRTPENEYRTKRLNQWVSAASAWLPTGAWENRTDAGRLVAPDEPVVLGFDGSWSNDSTALVGATCGPEPHVFVIACWESDGSPDWRVDTADVEHAIRAATERYRVREIVCDPYRWQDVLQRLERDGLPIVEFPTNALARIVPACQEFYAAVVDGRISHDGDPRLARHIANAVVKTDRYGPRIVKESRSSNRKIDLAVAAVIAHDRARQVEPPKRRAMFYTLDD